MKLLYTLLGMVLLVSTVQAESITTIQLRNRPAAEVIPVIEPMLGAGDAISGQGFKIFLRSSPQTLAQVKDMIAALDVASKMLQVSVFQGSTRGLRELGFGGNIRIENGDVSGSISTTSTQKRLQDQPIHQVRVIEGREAYIETGQQIPYFSGSHWIARKREIGGGIEYKDVISGFYVLPRIHGDDVTLQISPFKNSLKNANDGGIATQSASTTITGRVGQWLLIGGVSEQLKRAQSGTGSQISTRSRNNESIWIKADLVQ